MEKEYEPYGPEWEKEILKHKKPAIVAMLKKALASRTPAAQPKVKCSNCDEMVVPVSLGKMCPVCYYDKL